MAQLAGRMALITGGGGSLGIALARAFISEGARVVIADLSPDTVERACALLGKQAKGVVLDVSRVDSFDAVFDDITCQLGGLDILVNGAGYFDMTSLAEATEAQFDRIFEVNVKGLYFLCQRAAGLMIRQGRGGRIINIGSEAGRRGEAFNSIYSASKGAVINLTQSLAAELIGHGINVNAISPGVIDTPMLTRAAALVAKYECVSPEEAMKSFSADLPIGRLALPEELAGCAVFLASDAARYIVGQTYNVDGGRHMN